MPEKKTTSVSDYRKKLGAPKEVTTPSGAVFKVKRLSVMDYIQEGIDDIPNDFFKFIAELVSGQLADKKDDPAVKKNMELFEKYIKVTIEKGIIEPPTILVYDEAKKDTHLIYAELSQDDQKYLIDVISGKI